MARHGTARLHPRRIRESAPKCGPAWRCSAVQGMSWPGQATPTAHSRECAEVWHGGAVRCGARRGPARLHPRRIRESAPKCGAAWRCPAGHGAATPTAHSRECAEVWRGAAVQGMSWPGQATPTAHSRECAEVWQHEARQGLARRGWASVRQGRHTARCQQCAAV